MDEYKIENIAKKLKIINGSGKLAQILYKKNYEKHNITMTVTNVISSLIENITKKEFEISKSFRRMILSENEQIIIKMDFCVKMISIFNTLNGNKIVLKTDKFSDVLTKKKALCFNDIVYHIFDNTVQFDKKQYCLLFDKTTNNAC